jgi:hypothetical protein
VELIQTFTNAAVVALVGLILARMTHGLRVELKGDIAALRGELKEDNAGLRAELKEEIGDLRREVREDLAQMRGDIAGVRADLTRLAIGLGVERRAGND